MRPLILAAVLAASASASTLVTVQTWGEAVPYSAGTQIGPVGFDVDGVQAMAVGPPQYTSVFHVGYSYTSPVLPWTTWQATLYSLPEILALYGHAPIDYEAIAILDGLTPSWWPASVDAQQQAIQQWIWDEAGASYPTDSAAMNWILGQWSGLYSTYEGPHINFLVPLDPNNPSLVETYNPMPEPFSMALVGAGLIAIASLRARYSWAKEK